MNKDVHCGISLQQDQMKLCSVLVVCFPLKKFIPYKQIPVALPHCSPYLSPSFIFNFFLTKFSLNLQPLWFMFICFNQLQCTACFIVLWSFIYLMSCQGNQSFGVWHLKAFSATCFTKIDFFFMILNVFIQVINLLSHVAARHYQ